MSEVLPLALTMMVGPQIITAILLLTDRYVIKPSLAFIAGVALAAAFGVGVFYALASLIGLQGKSGSSPSTAAKIIQTIIIVLLILAAIKTFINREKIKLPKWMGKIENASPWFAFKTAVLLILIMPTDLAVMLTVGINRASHHSSAIEFLPFWALTVLIAALPLLTYLLFRKKAAAVMPKVRAWMEANSWVVSIAAYAVFIFLLW